MGSVGGVSNVAFVSGSCSLGAPDVFVLFSGLGGAGGWGVVTPRLPAFYVCLWSFFGGAGGRFGGV